MVYVMDVPTLNTELSREIWLAKYRYCQGDVVYDRTPNDTWLRVAKTLASVETKHVAEWETRFYDLLKGLKFLPGGRILAGAGTDRRVTLFNCFVMGLIEDSIDGIFDALKQGALTLQQGGGIGYDFSTIRPHGMTAHAARMLDNVIDVSRLPLPPQQHQARGTRRIGLGITGLADALIMLGARYGDRSSYELAAEIMKTICHGAYQSSVELAREKDPFPWFDKKRYLEGRVAG